MDFKKTVVFIKIIKSNGPISETCGTPIVKGCLFEALLLN